jgi:hypothetical protein
MQPDQHPNEELNRPRKLYGDIFGGTTIIKQYRLFIHQLARYSFQSPLPALDKGFNRPKEDHKSLQLQGAAGFFVTIRL